MIELFAAISLRWKTSKSFRVWTILAGAALVLFALSTYAWLIGAMVVKGMPPVSDLKVYLDAASRFLAHQALYLPPTPDFWVFVYSPAAALLFTPLIHIPLNTTYALDMLFHLAAYFLMYWTWYRIFQRHGLEAAADRLVRLLPLWLVFTGILLQLYSLNIYISMALLASLLIQAVLDERAGLATVCLAILLPIKPQWAFALGIPFILKRWRFFGKAALGSLLAYLAVAVLTIAIGGNYAFQQYRAYFRFLGTIPDSFHWNMLSVEGYLGYNNSIMQLVKFFGNNAPFSGTLTTVLKLAVTLPLGLLVLAALRRKSPDGSPARQLEWAFALYLAAFFWIDVMTELSFGIVIFAYILGTSASRAERAGTGIVFLPYAFVYLLIMAISTVDMAVLGPTEALDPGEYVPLVLIAQAGLYVILLLRLARSLAPGETGNKKAGLRPARVGVSNDWT